MKRADLATVAGNFVSLRHQGDQHLNNPLTPNFLPSGMTMGTSGSALSAERDPDSLEREDDSLFPACFLELFLSHISPAKSPLFFFLGLFLAVNDS